MLGGKKMTRDELKKVVCVAQKECNELELIIAELEIKLAEREYQLEVDRDHEDLDYYENVVMVDEDMGELIANIEWYNDKLQLLMDKIEEMGVN
jgi:hypothetical protein